MAHYKDDVVDITHKGISVKGFNHHKDFDRVLEEIFLPHLESFGIRFKPLNEARRRVEILIKNEGSTLKFTRILIGEEEVTRPQPGLPPFIFNPKSGEEFIIEVRIFQEKSGICKARPDLPKSLYSGQDLKEWRYTHGWKGDFSGSIFLFRLKSVGQKESFKDLEHVSLEALQKEIIKAQSLGIKHLSVPLVALVTLMRETPSWFIFENSPTQNAKRVIGYAYDVTLLLGRLEGEPGVWNF
jgi:hypothetical protein